VDAKEGRLAFEVAEGAAAAVAGEAE
jgi:hypothetical protein